MSQRDLQHFLRLAEIQVRRRAEKIEATPVPQPEDARKLASLRLLDELIKEQIPHEDPRPATRPAR